MGKAPKKKMSPSQADKPEAGKPQRGQPGKAEGRDISLIYKPATHLALIVILGFLIYSNTFQSPFQWDEADYIVKNPVIKDLGIFTNPARVQGLPFYGALKSRYAGYLTFALNYKFHGFNVPGYHVVNLAIHIVNALLVYFLVLLTFRTPYFRSEKLKVKGERLVESSEKAGNSQSTIPDSRVAGDSLFTIHYSRFFALVASLLFVAHPIQTEAVTYVFQRFASLVSLFYLLSLALYIKGRLKMQSAERNAQGDKESAVSPQHSAIGKLFTIHDSRFTAAAWFIFSFAAAILAMKTKENAFTLPVVIALYEFLFFAGPWKSRALILAPFLLTMLIVPLTIMGLGGSAGQIMSEIKDPVSLGYRELSGAEYFLTQFRVILTYMRLLVFPENQNLVYDYPVYKTLFTPAVLLSCLFLGSVFGAAVYLIYKSRPAISCQCSAFSDNPPLSPLNLRGELKGGAIHYSLFTFHYFRLIAFGVLWFFITLSVESGVIPLPMVIDEYRVYLPSVGFFIAVTSAMFICISRFLSHRAKSMEHSAKLTAQGKNALRFALCTLLILVIALSWATYSRNTLWKDKVSLWEDTAAKSPNLPMALNNLGLAYEEKGLNEKAIGMYKRCISLNRSFHFAYMNLGIVYAKTGRTGMAIENFEMAVSLKPNDPVAYANLARAYGETGRIDKAAENYAKVIDLNPYDSSAYHGLGTAYAMLGRLDDALAAYSKFVTLSPGDPEAYRSRGFVYAKKGDVRDAAADFQKSCSLGSRESCEYLKGMPLR